jgi:uncharacterized protein YdgA (DUF945 family)
MKKLLLLITPPILIALSSIPYWTGKEIERQFPTANQAILKRFDLKPLDSSYERGWFRSHAQTLVKSKSRETSNTAAIQESRFILVHEIDHGFLPIQSPLIHTTLHPENRSDTEVSDKEPLLEVHTTVQMNGDSVSRLKMPAQQVKDEKAHLQWQNLEGIVESNRNFSAIQMEIHSPQIQLETDQGQIVIQQISLKADVQLGSANFMQGEGRLSIADIRMAGKQNPPVTLKGLELVGNNKIVSDNLMIGVKTGLQQIQVGADRYGPGSGHFELLRWHVPTLKSIKNTLTEIQNQGLPQKQQANMAMLRLMPYGVALLKNVPEIAITHLNFNMPEGEIRGTLRVKMAEFDGLGFVLFNPALLLNALDAQLEMYIPQSLLHDSSTSEQTIRQSLKTWLDKGFLIPAEDQPNYYYSQMQLKGGLLEVNGQPLPVAAILK